MFAVLVQVRSACQEYFSFLRATEMPQVVYRGTQQRAAKFIAKQSKSVTMDSAVRIGTDVYNRTLRV